MRRRRREKKDRPTPILDEQLRESMLRLGARDPMFIGFVLAGSRRARGLTPEQQAEVLGISVSALALLSMCKVPRPDQRDADLAAVAKQVGITVEVLERLLGDAGAGEPTLPSG
jgi:hypothetical protein